MSAYKKKYVTKQDLADIVQAWADGKEIEYWSDTARCWYDTDGRFLKNTLYRIAEGYDLDALKYELDQLSDYVRVTSQHAETAMKDLREFLNNHESILDDIRER